MNKLILLLAVFFLISCSDSYFEESDGASFKQFIYLLPDGFTGDPTELLRPMIEANLEQGQSVRFSARYTINGNFVSKDSAATHYKNLLWEIDGEYFTLDVFRYTFKKSGIINGKLMTIDEYLDTLVTEFSIRVNTPEEFTINFPYDGYNQAEPSMSTDMPFRWTLTGLDEWESAKCEVYLSTNSSEVWDHKIGTLDCMNEANLWGPLVGDSAMLSSMGIDLRKTSYTFYWGVKYSIYTSEASWSSYSTPIYHFSTKFLDQNTSRLIIPLYYSNLEKQSILKTTAYIVNASGDTLKTYTGSTQNQQIRLNLEPQTGVKIYFQEESLQDYTADPIQVDLPPGTVVQTETVYFTDHVAPQIAPASSHVRVSENVVFLIYDDGSGVNTNQVTVFLDDNQIEKDLVRKDNSIEISLACYNTCTVAFKGADYALNSLPDLYWNITRDGNYYQIDGPFRKNAGGIQ